MKKNNLKVILIITDRLCVNAKMVYVLCSNLTSDENNIVALRRYPIRFTSLSNIYFILFYIIYLVKFISNNMICKGNYFKYYSFNLLDDYTILAEYYNIYIIQQLYKSNMKLKRLL